MKRLQFKTTIQAPAENVYRAMLGLDDPKTYQTWTKAFNGSSGYEGSWDKGSRIYFIGLDENGKKGGMVSEIAENTPNRFVSIRHIGMLDGDREITTGELVEAWAGAHENYTFEERDGVTDLTIEVDTVEDHASYFDETWPTALQALKALCES